MAEFTPYWGHIYIARRFQVHKWLYYSPDWHICPFESSRRIRHPFCCHPNIAERVVVLHFCSQRLIYLYFLALLGKIKVPLGPSRGLLHLLLASLDYLVTCSHSDFIY